MGAATFGDEAALAAPSRTSAGADPIATGLDAGGVWASKIFG